MRKTYTLKMGCLLGDQAAIYLMKLMTGEEVVAEYRFHPSRDWRFDFAIPSRRVAIEVEGGAFNGGRHIRPDGYLRDMEKYNEAAVCGWCVIRVLPTELLTFKTVRLIIRAIQN